MRNYSEAICNKQKRQLTAKGNKFVNRCIKIALNKQGLNSRLLPEAKPTVKKLNEIIHYLLIDQELTINEVTEIIKNRIEKNTLN
jgi:hypothetical protein